MVAGKMLNRVVWRLLRRALAVAAGCGVMGGLACCGKPMPPPEVHLTSTSILPEGTITPGQVLHARAKLSEPETSGRISIVLSWDFGDQKQHHLKMYDDGRHGDTAANDGEYALDLVWKKAYVRGDSVKMRVAVRDQYYGILNGSSEWTTLTVKHSPAGSQ